MSIRDRAYAPNSCSYEIYWFPLVGDPKYGPRKTLDIGGQALHAGVIGFEHPVTHEYIERQAELPKEFETLLEDIRLRDA